LKSNITELSPTLAKLASLKVVNFTWNDTAATLYANSTVETQIGYIAQNVESIFPELVVTNKQGYKEVNYSGLTLYAIRGMGELALLHASTTQTLNTLIAESASSTAILGELTLASSTIIATHEGDTFWSRLTNLVQSFVDGVLTVLGIHTKELCISDETGAETCLDKLQLDALLYNMSSTTVSGEDAGESEESNEDVEAPLEFGDEDAEATSENEDGEEYASTTPDNTESPGDLEDPAEEEESLSEEENASGETAQEEPEEEILIGDGESEEDVEETSEDEGDTPEIVEP
jgi:hypothetical protein